jgi:uncharacterized protein
VVEEEGSQAVGELCMRSRGVACSGLGYVEGSAAIARRGPEGSVDAMRAILDRIWADLIVIHASEDVLVSAAALAPRHRLRGYDAVHLASALMLRERTGPVVFTCWDNALNDAAKQQGLDLSPTPS